MFGRAGFLGALTIWPTASRTSPRTPHRATRNRAHIRWTSLTASTADGASLPVALCGSCLRVGPSRWPTMLSVSGAETFADVLAANERYADGFPLRRLQARA